MMTVLKLLAPFSHYETERIKLMEIILHKHNKSSGVCFLDSGTRLNQCLDWTGLDWMKRTNERFEFTDG